MSTYRQLPEVFRRLHPRFKTPWLSLLVFAGFVSILVILPGQTDFLGTMYSFGAMLSFTVAHASVIALRYRHRDAELSFRARPNLRWRGVDWPLFAVFGGTATALAWLVVVVQDAATRWAGLGWLAVGFVVYVTYRRRFLHAPLRETIRAPVVIVGLSVEYRTIVVPILRTAESEEALVAAARLASERGARIVIVAVVEVPLDLPLDAWLPGRVREANETLDDAQALVESYGVAVTTRLLRDRRAGPAIVREAGDRTAELIVLGSTRRAGRRGAPVFGKTVDHVLKNAPCRVLVAAGKRKAAA